MKVKNMILAIETSTPVCSVALGKNGRVLAEKRIEGRGVHSERTFTFVKELFERFEIGINDLEAVLFSNGPGSYTGLRIGAGAVKGLLFGKQMPLYTLPTLLSFSLSAAGRENRVIHSVIDARRDHLYHQKTELFSGKKMNVSKARVMKLSDIENEIEVGDVVVGTGWDRLTVENREQVRWLGTEAISSKNLIIGWYQKEYKLYFKEQNAETFEPEYLTMAQINNSAV